MFVHIVLFWMKDGAPPQHAEDLQRDCDELLSNIPSLRHIWYGKAAGTDRPVVDNSYDTALCTVFDSSEDHDAYQVHELHQEFLARHRDNWERIQVYDFQ